MFRPRLLSTAILLALATSANASSFVVTTDALVRGVNATSNATSNLSSRDRKIVREAHDDAAAFVASQGGIRGAKLESALACIRQQAPGLKATDDELAQAILTI